MTTQESHTIICPKCDRTQKECVEQAEDKDNGNPITKWVPHNWGLSCDECYLKNHPESDDCEVLSDDDCIKGGKDWTCGCVDEEYASVNTQEECCECYITEKQYNKKKGYESNLLTLHYIGGKTYCPYCRDPQNSDDEDEDTSLE